MKFRTTLGVGLYLAGAFLSCMAATAAKKGAVPQESRAQYQQQRAQCMDRATEDRAACLREAGAALQGLRRGELDDHGANFEQNRLARCSYLKGDDRGDCERRMHGEGMASGSVESGGIYRELRTTVPAEEKSSSGR